MNLVTGATGIIGSHVALHLLQQGKPVTAGRRQGGDIEKTKRLFQCYGAQHLFEKLKWVTLDLTDIFSIEDVLNDVQTVYHCAGYVSFQEKDTLLLKQLNENATANLVNACLFKGVKNLCHVSSIATINNNDYNGKLSEGVFWKTSGKESYYAISKYNAEREVWRGGEEGLNIAIVNPGVVLSPVFIKQSSGNLIGFCKKGNRFYTEGKTAYVAATDVAKAMVELMDKQIYNERFILAENHYTNKEILSLIQKAFGHAAPQRKVSKSTMLILSVFDAFASLVTGRNRRLNKEIIRATFGVKEFSAEKIKDKINFSFAPLNDYVSFIGTCEKD